MDIQLRKFEESINNMSRMVDELTLRQRRQWADQTNHFSKIMEGFACIERAFKMNCNAQLTMCQQIDSIEGNVTDLTLTPLIPSVS